MLGIVCELDLHGLAFSHLDALTRPSIREIVQAVPFDLAGDEIFARGDLFEYEVAFGIRFRQPDIFLKPRIRRGEILSSPSSRSTISLVYAATGSSVMNVPSMRSSSFPSSAR